MNWEAKQKAQFFGHIRVWMMGKARAAKLNAPVSKVPCIFPCISDYDYGSKYNLRKEKPKIVKTLERLGFKKLGSGYYSTVYSHPKSNKVLKVMHKVGEDGWIDYVKWANDNGYGGNFAPKLYSYKYIPKYSCGLALMEKLDTTVGDLYDLSSEEVDKANRANVLTLLSREVIQNRNKTAAQFVDITFPGYAKFLNSMVEKFGEKRYYDVHTHNWMLRGDQLVLTDPINDIQNSSYKERYKSAA